MTNIYILFKGNPGTGKTQVMRIISEILNKKGLKTEEVGETKLKVETTKLTEPSKP